ncbi:Abi family protein [Brevibacterium sp. CSND-B09]|uniref:Abi family protein n=1 Tax=Brevibacterium sp. CSND-B09 TaxID=3462571 RepID=UPI00406A62DD
MSNQRRALRLPRPRGNLRYDKPALELETLVDRLADRGLVVPDRDHTLRYLRHIGYYRLSSSYTIPFQQSGTDQFFREGTSIDDVLDLYVFDRALRLLVMDALERVEVAVRAALTDHNERSISRFTMLA